MKLWKDFGVSALGLTLILLIMGIGGLLLVWKGEQEFALAWIGSLGTLSKVFYDGYISYKHGVG